MTRDRQDSNFGPSLFADCELGRASIELGRGRPAVSEAGCVCSEVGRRHPYPLGTCVPLEGHKPSRLGVLSMLWWGAAVVDVCCVFSLGTSGRLR